MDSPKLCENAAARWFSGGCTGCARGPKQEHEADCKEKESHPLWDSYTYLDWIEVEHTVIHETRVKWVSDWLLEDAAAWAKEAPGIVWVDHPEFGERLARMSGLRYYGGGEKAGEEMAEEFSVEQGISSKSIICSMAAHKKGKNLQHSFHRNLIVAFPASNDTVEQLVGRTYRPGQYADSVEVYYYLHTPELESSLEKAKERAHFVAETMGQAQKLVYGSFRS
jgi:hypothetical protein